MERVDASSVWRTRLTVGSAALLVAAVLAAYVLQRTFVAAHQVLGWVVASSVVALLIDPLVDRVDRLLPRWLSIIVVLLAVIGATIGLTFALANDVHDSLDELQRAAPEAAASLEERYGWAADVGVQARVQDAVDALDQRLSDDPVSEAIGIVPAYFVTAILMLFLLAYGRRYVESFAEQFRDPQRRRTVRTVAVQAGVRGRRYLLFALANSIVNGVVVGALAAALDLPAAVSLGVAVGVLTLLPLIGVIVGGVPTMLLAFGLEGWRVGAIVAVVLVALQLVEAIVVRRAVDPQTVRVGPTVPIVGALLGFELYGVGGAMYGVALAVIGLATLDTAGSMRDDVPASRPAEATG